MAAEFGEWLKTAIEKHASEVEKPILIVGVTGKSVSSTDKQTLIDQILEYTIFCGRYQEDSLINVRFLVCS